MFSQQSSSPRRTHRKRLSALHLSSDTTATLPEYYQASAAIHSWQRHTQDSSIEQDIPSDKPPDYPDSAEEADEDTDSENHRNTFFVQQLPTGTPALPRSTHSAATSSPRRKQRYQHRRKHSAPTPNFGYSETSPVDPYLDSLLERSVHALEISNTLLQTSMTTQTSLSTVLGYDSPVDQNLESRAMNLSARIKGNWDNQASWMEDMEEIRKRVDSLFGDGKDLDGIGTEGGGQHAGVGHKIRSKEDWRRHLNSSLSSNSEAGMSSSLPTTASPLQQRSRPQRRRPSLDLREAVAAESSEAGRLRLSHRTREQLIAPPPRALTQYIEPGADPAFITLPSTLGIRSNASIYPNADCNASTTSLHSSPALPIVTETPLPSSSTPAYTKLASFIIKRPSNSANATPSSSFTSSFMVTRRNSSSERGRRRSPQPSPRRSFEIIRSHTLPSPTSPLPSSHHHRPMTPTTEESSSSSDGVLAKQTISSLRKILDEQPIPEDSRSVASSNATAKRKTVPIQLTPPVPVSGTSNATASISRMLTKKVHHSSARPPSPPRQSAMKGSRPATPSSTTTTFTVPSASVGDSLVVPERPTGGMRGLITRPSRGQQQSASSSGRSTPKRISFAELPEAHISSRPEKFRDKGKRKGKSKAKTRGKGGSEESEKEDGGSGWLAALFGLNPNAGLAYASRQEERMEDRISRSWGGRGGGGGYGYMDEWAV